MSSKMKTFFAILTLVAFGALPACKKEEPAPEKKEESSPKKPAPPKAPEAEVPFNGPLTPTVPTTPMSKTPVYEELEPEAAKSVGADNLEAELDRLEAEILGGQ